MPFGLANRRRALRRFAVAALLSATIGLAACGQKPAVPAGAIVPGASDSAESKVFASVYPSEVSQDVYRSRNVTPGLEWGVGW